MKPKQSLVYKLESPIMIQPKCALDNRLHVLQDRLGWPTCIEEHMIWRVVVGGVG